MAEFSTETGTIFYEILGDYPDSDHPDSSKSESNQPDGSRPWVILIHNFMSTGRTAWGKVAEKLAARYRILLFDLPGHGRSAGYPDNFAYRAMARQIAALMAHVGAETGHLAGCSAGGMIAQWLVHEQWVSPPTLTLVSTTHSINPETAGAPVTTDPDNFRFGRNWLDATAKLHDEHHGDGYFRREILPRVQADSPDLALDLPLAQLDGWAMPVCIIHGEEDELFPVEIARNMAAQLPAARLHVVSAQGHALIFRQPWKVAGIMQDFLTEYTTALS